MYVCVCVRTRAVYNAAVVVVHQRDLVHSLRAMERKTCTWAGQWQSERCSGHNVFSLALPSTNALRTMYDVQEYNMSKRFEHSFKSLSHDGSTISAVNPRAYANRFQDFMKKVFV